MFDRFRARLRDVLARLRRIERRELREFRRWIEATNNLIHLSVLVFVPLLIAVVTALSNVVPQLSYLLFPPLAAGTYMLFADPEGEYASPVRFVGGLTAGAFCGWAALTLAPQGVLFNGGAGGGAGGGAVGSVSPVGAALAVFLTGAATWALDIEEPAAYSTALLALVTRTTSIEYVVSIALSSLLVAGAFLLWREQFYERRARILYESVKGDDHVLVPMRGERPEPTAMLGARLAAAHDAGKVILLDLVSSRAAAAAERAHLGDDSLHHPRAPADGPPPTAGREDDPVARQATELEQRAGRIETRIGVPCEVVVAVDGGNPATTTLRAAREANCDLIAAPYEEYYGGLSTYVRRLFRGDVDVVVHRSVAGRTRWRSVMVPIRRAGDVAHEMVDFAVRLAGQTGHVSVSHCIDSEQHRRPAEGMLADVVEAFSGPIETRVARADLLEFLADTAPAYDLLIVGASRDRSTASRLVSPPTFERLQDVETDVLVVDRN
ncbi:universal stress protein UspA [Halobacteriales archaeon QS_1_68_17]|nr:MAG: universal stress protein UspA [Halobacteriales archaeon QS_1_68_17]